MLLSDEKKKGEGDPINTDTWTWAHAALCMLTGIYIAKVCRPL